MIAVSPTRRDGHDASVSSRDPRGVLGAGEWGSIGELQRARIVTAATDVVAERGVTNVSVADIVARSGVSRRTFYELFADREECLLAALEQALTQAARSAIPAYESRERWQDRVRAGLLELLSFIDSHPAQARVLLVESATFGIRAQSRRAEIIAQLARVLDDGRLGARNKYDPPALTAEGAVGAALSIAQSSIGDPGRVEPLVVLIGPLMSMIVLPYLGAAAARRELERPLERGVLDRREVESLVDPFKAAGMRLTYRTARVLAIVAELGVQGSYPSNRLIGDAAEIRDQGQVSKLLGRLARLGLIENSGPPAGRGAPNAWRLTSAGEQMMQSVRASSERASLELQDK